MNAPRMSAKRKQVFKSVFDAEISQPTPYATPLVRSSEQGQPFGGHVAPGAGTGQHPEFGFGTSASTIAANPSQPASSATDVTDQAKWDRAWHVVTSRVHLPASVAAEDSFGALAPESQDCNQEFYDSLRVVLYPSQFARHAAYTEDVLSWHTQQSRNHFVNHVLPLLSACQSSPEAADVVEGSIHTLEAAHRQYFYGLELIIRGMEEVPGRIALAKFRCDLHAIVSNSTSQPLAAALRDVLGRLLRVALGMTPETKSKSNLNLGVREDAQTTQARQDLQRLVDGLQRVGLAGEKFQVLFAEMLDAFMVEHVKSFFAGWEGQGRREPPPSSLRQSLRPTAQSERISALHDWIEDSYARLAVEVFSRLEGVTIPWKEVERWKDIAVGRLAVLRIHQLFDIVLHWPASKDALDDLRMAVTTPQRRLQLTDTFSEALQTRLLHSGRSTLDILQVYIAMIRTFHALDHSKVLLDRVVHALQLYLCQRDDAIRIVVTGLLSSSEDIKAGAGKGKLIELAVLLNDPSQQRRSASDDDELDWDDMHWVPDPVDAGVNYKRPKSEDVIGTLINALGAQDIFIKEFQAIVAERLLSKQSDLSQELKVLALLKKKFGENALQNCDVMIKDIQDSKRVDAVITKNLRQARQDTPDRRAVTPLFYHTKILSRLFWPALDREHFLLPAPVIEAQERYAHEFEHLKSSRKLTWLNNHGTATVRLDLEDRTVEKECKTYEAAVIHAFHSDDDAPGPVQRTVDELYMALQLDDDIVRLALAFWVSQRVLREVSHDTYVVLERLDGEAPDADAGAEHVQSPLRDAGSPAKPAKSAVDAQEKERRQVYWQFIVGMLTNSAPAMPLPQMAMMMKMLIADGFAWGNEELQEFLGEKIAEKELELVGGKYRLPKK